MAPLRTIGIAAGSGLASALLFAASAKGGMLAIVIAYVTPLPIMIAALGFGQATGLLAAGLAFGAIALLLGFMAAGFFGVLVGFPSWWLAYLSLLARPTPERPSADAVSWYPIGRLVAWGAAIVASVILAFGAATLLHYGGYSAALAALTDHLKSILDGSPTERPIAESAAAVVRVLPALMAGSTFLMLMFNLWLAARVVQGSGLLSRPWPALPENLRLPRIAAGVVVVAALCAFAGGLVGIIAGVVAAPLGIAFMLQGLGAAHALTRGLAARRLILFAIYFITFSVVPSLLALVVLGLVDCLLPLRKGQRPQTPFPTKS